MREIHECFGWYVRMGAIRTGARMQRTKTSVLNENVAPGQLPRTRVVTVSAPPPDPRAVRTTHRRRDRATSRTPYLGAKEMVARRVRSSTRDPSRQVVREVPSSARSPALSYLRLVPSIRVEACSDVYPGRAPANPRLQASAHSDGRCWCSDRAALRCP